MVGSECKVGRLGEFGYLTCQGGLLLEELLFPSVGGQSEEFVCNL